MNADGSVDVYFGPKVPAGKETNWVQTVPEGLEHDSAPLWAFGALVRQDLAAGRDRTPVLTTDTSWAADSSAILDVRLGSLADIDGRIGDVRFAPLNGHSPKESLQTELQTNHASQHGTEHNEGGSLKLKLANRSPYLGTEVTRGSMRIVELENRCAGNRTVGSNPTLSASTQRITTTLGCPLWVDSVDKRFSERN